MSRTPDVFIGRVFVPAGRREDVAVALSARRLWINPEEPRVATFRGGGPNGFMVEGEHLLVMGDSRAFGQLGAVLTNLDLARYNPELFCEETQQRAMMDLPC